MLRSISKQSSESVESVQKKKKRRLWLEGFAETCLCLLCQYQYMNSLPIHGYLVSGHTLFCICTRCRRRFSK